MNNQIQDGTTADYLQNLVNDRDTLVTNLVSKGVEASNTETFTELVPKVLDIQPDLESKSITISTNTVTTIRPTEGKDGLSSVEVTTNVPQPSGKIEITQNGTDIDVSSYSTADVSVISEKVSLNAGGTVKFISSTSTTQEIQNAVNDLIQKIDFSTMASAQWMFQNCTNLTTIDLSNLETTNITTFNAMFFGCTNLTEIDLSLATTKNEINAINISSMFDRDTSLTKIDMRNFNFTKANNYSNMFGTSSAYCVPDNCLIIVKDATQKQWLNTNFSRMTNVKTVAEYEAEQGGAS